MKNNQRRVTVIFILFVASILVGISFYGRILAPAHLSTVIGCNLTQLEEGEDFVILGSFDRVTKEICITENLSTEARIRTEKHERTHAIQDAQGRFFSCNSTILNYPVGVFLNEVEAQISEVLP